MCGLVGMAGVLTANHDRAMKSLLIVDSIRGIDSTGIAGITRHGPDILMAKSVGHAFDLFDQKGYDKVIARQNRALIGHNRWSTVGASTKNNAHPFQFDHIVGAHNGTLTNKYALLDGNFFAVDSQALFNHIDKKGLEDAIAIAGGAWALTFWDSKDETINFLRNKERPLYLCEATDGKSIFWASESWMLTACLSRNDIKHTDPWLLKEDEHYWLQINKAGEFVTEGFNTVKSKFVPFVNQGGYGTYNRGVNNPPIVAATPAPAPAPNKDTALPKVVSIESARPSYAGSKNRTLRVVAKGSDGNGALYLQCIDKDPDIEVKAPIRMYIHASSADGRLIGEDIIADIDGKAKYHPTTGMYYKVVYSTVRRAKPEGDVVKKLIEATNKQLEVVDKEIRDHKGNMITETEWYSRYTCECAMCGGAVMATSPGKRYTNQGDLICSDCVDDPVTLQYVQLV